MNIGLQIPRFNWPGGPKAIAARLADIARTAEDAGFASIWVMDHFLQIPFFGEVDDPMLESYTTLGYLASVTRETSLGALVTGVSFRPPALLIKAATTLDVLSGGRAYLSLGSSWYEDEAVALGIPYPQRSVRYELLEETAQLARRMWSGDLREFDGRHIHAARPLSRPQPLTRPHPPILIGGNGERRTLRLVAEYADACNLLSQQPEGVRQKLDVLKRHCDDSGRPYEAIEKTSLNSVSIAPAGSNVLAIVDWLNQMEAAGIQHAIVNMEDVHEIWPLEIFGREIIPAVAGELATS